MNGAFAPKNPFRFEPSGEFPQVPAKACVRLSGTDNVSEKRVMSLEDAPYSRLLMRMKLDGTARAGKR